VSALAILNELQRRGVSITADADDLVLKPRRAIDSELLARVRDHKLEIIRLLSVRPPACAPSCYEIEPGRWIHHPWDGCRTPITELAEPIVPTQVDCGCPGGIIGASLAHRNRAGFGIPAGINGFKSSTQE
jgi:hypothetical protein